MSSIVEQDLKEHIKDLEQLIRDFDAFMLDYYPYTWQQDPKCLILRERIRELVEVNKAVQP